MTVSLYPPGMILPDCILQVWSYLLVSIRVDRASLNPQVIILADCMVWSSRYYDCSASLYPPGLTQPACFFQVWSYQPVSSSYDPVILYPPGMILPTCVLKVWSYLVWFCQTVSSCYKPASLKPPGMTVSLCPPDMILSALILYEFKKLKIDITDNLYLKDLWIYSRVE